MPEFKISDHLLARKTSHGVKELPFNDRRERRAQEERRLKIMTPVCFSG
jgi:hypothetical protein